MAKKPYNVKVTPKTRVPNANSLKTPSSPVHSYMLAVKQTFVYTRVMAKEAISFGTIFFSAKVNILFKRFGPFQH